MPEDRPTISSARLSAAEVSRHSFMTVRRGFDPSEVRSFLELVSRELQLWEQRDLDLRRELGEAEERASHPVLDESTLSAALGQQSAQVLRGAHESAARIVDQAEHNAAALLRDAQRQANDAQIRAESAAAERIAEAELSAGSIQQQVQQRTESALTAARAESETLVAQARDHGRDMLEQAQQARKRVLADLAQRRRALHTQIEQFRAARDELAAAVLGVRASVDAIVADLSGADDQARAAAARVARHGPSADAPGEDAGDVPADELSVDGEPAGETPAVSEAGPAVVSPAGAPAGPGPDDTGPDAAGPDDTGPNDTGTDDTGTEETGPDDTGPKATGRGKTGPDDTGPDDTETRSVEQLFARIRASADPEAAPAEEGLDQGEGVRLVPGPSEGRPDRAGDEAPTDPAPESTADRAGRPLLEERRLLLDPVATTLGRRLKRSLQDDQNRLLDRLRSSGPKSPPDEDLLASEEEQRAVFAEASSPLLAEAFATGVRYAQEQLPGDVAPPEGDTVEPMASELAGTVVTQIRRRLGGERVTRAGGDEEAERVGAAYREWRGERIERLVGDYAVAAFSAGVLATAAGLVDVRWVVSGSDTACSDCHDNSLAGEVAAGAEFPTGHRHPPAHAGCRCLVTPIRA